MCEEKMVFKTALKPLTFPQNLKLGHDTGVHSFPTVYRKPHLDTYLLKFNLVLGEGQARYSGSKIAKNKSSSRPECKIRL